MVLGIGKLFRAASVRAAGHRAALSGSLFLTGFGSGLAEAEQSHSCAWEPQSTAALKSQPVLVWREEIDFFSTKEETDSEVESQQGQQTCCCFGLCLVSSLEPLPPSVRETLLLSFVWTLTANGEKCRWVSETQTFLLPPGFVTEQLQQCSLSVISACSPIHRTNIYVLAPVLYAE